MRMGTMLLVGVLAIGGALMAFGGFSGLFGPAAATKAGSAGKSDGVLVLTNWDEALDQARKQSKPILLNFGGPW